MIRKASDYVNCVPTHRRRRLFLSRRPEGFSILAAAVWHSFCFPYFIYGL